MPRIITLLLVLLLVSLVASNDFYSPSFFSPKSIIDGDRRYDVILEKFGLLPRRGSPDYEGGSPGLIGSDEFEHLVWDQQLDEHRPNVISVKLYPSVAFVEPIPDSHFINISARIPVTVFAPSRYVYFTLKKFLSYYLNVHPEENAVFRSRLKSIMLGGLPSYSVEATVKFGVHSSQSFNVTSDGVTDSEGFLNVAGTVEAGSMRLSPTVRGLMSRFLITNLKLYQQVYNDRVLLLETSPTFKFRDHQRAVSFSKLLLGAASDIDVTAAPVVPYGGKGYAFVSDIDDTIKITEVLSKARLLRNVFVNPMLPVPDMNRLYQSFFYKYRNLNSSHLFKNFADPSFHYVSNSPLQLYSQLENFRSKNGFPAGSIHLRPLDFTKPNIFKKLANSTHKVDTITALLRNMPKRTFVLIGDSTEHDPEVYASIARMSEFKGRIRCIWIRMVEQENSISGIYKNSVERFMRAMEDVPRRKWGVFHYPDELASIDLRDKYQHCHPLALKENPLDFSNYSST